MEIKEVRSAELKQDYVGHVYLVLDLDGRQAEVYAEQKLFPYGLVFIGDSDFPDFTAIVPADPDNDMPEPTEFKGFTNDLIVYRLVRWMREELFEGRFKLGPVKIPTLADVVMELN